ncbi:MAG: indolepyruvate ferredoxin oxidoreductase subunit alpha [Desulfotomaculum sp.]|nr:indolepyruvate ferredoxin oxidoreductase subunit alpha [Desulfotomaculum sp.]
MKKLLMGNEAIAYGAVEAGIKLAAGYPGTPSSEILTTLAKLAKQYNFYAEWSVNEKVALEVAAGASYCGARCIVTMKQVGLNVAADPLMTLAYIGVKGGLVLAVADDPGPHSSQNEQDTRKFAQFAKLPVLDPSDPQEAKEMTKAAFNISEQLGLPVILRPTTRTCHACQDVEILQPRIAASKLGFKKDSRWVIFPSLAAKQHRWLNKQQAAASDIFENISFNSLEFNDTELGVAASGVSYLYVKEALEILGIKASVLKIGTPYPLPNKLCKEFLQKHKRILVVEEQEPVVEDQLIKIAYENKIDTVILGKNSGYNAREGELNVNKVIEILTEVNGIPSKPKAQHQLPELPVRPPVLCSGCPHRASFYAFKQAVGNNAVFTGDIGCYTLGSMQPLNAVDTCLCMGASITIASGMEKVEKGRKQVAFLGDSTFFHTGIPGLINAVYNKSDITIVVLDNRTTAMTGHQPHPGLDSTATGEPAKGLDIAKIASACGVKLIKTVDPYDLEAAVKAAREAVDFPGPSVVIMKRECAALKKERKESFYIDQDLCLGCGICVEELGCPAIEKQGDDYVINYKCAGCGVCAQVCPNEAVTGGTLK